MRAAAGSSSSSLSPSSGILLSMESTRSSTLSTFPQLETAALLEVGLALGFVTTAAACSSSSSLSTRSGILLSIKSARFSTSTVLYMTSSSILRASAADMSYISDGKLNLSKLPTVNTFLKLDPLLNLTDFRNSDACLI